MKLSYQVGQKPLWSQLYDILEMRILSGEYKEGDTLPSEVAIMQEFDVSRITVRQAMDKLIQAQLISRQRGKGTVVLKYKNKVTTAFQSSFQEVKEKNQLKDRQVIAVESVKAPSEVAYFFDIPTSDSVIKLTRQTFINEEVVACYETYLHPLVPLTVQDDFKGSLYTKLEIASYPITNVMEKISAALISTQEKKIFSIEQDEAVMHRIRMGYSHDLAIEYTYAPYLARGYELIIDLK